MSRRSSQAVNAVLIGVALALVVLVVATRDKMTTSEIEARENNLLANYEEQKITRVRLERKTGSFTLVRQGGADGGVPDWKLTEPLTEDAEPFAVQKLMGTLELSGFVRRIKPEEVNRAAFGLDDPSLVVHVDMGDVKYRLRLGVPAASPKDARYLEIAGENAPGKGVVIVSKSLVAELDVKVDDFRERYVMPYLSSLLSGLTLESAAGTTKLVRAPWKDGFRFDGMLGNARTARTVLDRMLVQFSRTRADHFMDAAVAEKAQAGAALVKVTMTPLDPKNPVGVVEVGGACPDAEGDVVAFRKLPDHVAACVPSSVLAGFTTPADAMVDRTLFWMRNDEVEGFEVEQGGVRLALDRKESGFVMRAPREGTVDVEAGNARLDAILHATGNIVRSPELDAGFANPFGKVTVRSSASDDSQVRQETVVFSPPAPDGRVYAKRLADGAIIELGREAARALVADAALVRSRTLIDAPIADVARIEVQGAVSQILDRAESGTFTLVSPPGFSADGSLALELSDALRSLSVDRWVTDKDDGTFGLDAPLVTARLSLRKGEGREEHVLRLGKAGSSGYFGSLDSDPGVFVVPRRLEEILTTLAIDRGVFLMDTSITAKVALETKDRTVVLEKRGDEFQQTDATEPLSSDAIRRIVDTLSVLHAEAAITTGAPRPEEGMDRPILTVRVTREVARAGVAPTLTYRVGAGDSYRAMSVHYARVDGIAATYAVARGAVRTLLDSL